MNAFVAFLVCAVVLTLTACSPTTSGPVAGDELRNLNADQVVYGVYSIMTSEGMRRGILHADSAYSFDDDARMELFEPRVQFFDEHGVQSGELTSATGSLDMRTEAMVARGNVVLVTVQANRRIETEELHFDPAQNRIWSDSASTIHEDGTVVRGQGFTSDTRFERVRIIRPTGRIEGVRFEF